MVVAVHAEPRAEDAVRRHVRDAVRNDAVEEARVRAAREDRHGRHVPDVKPRELEEEHGNSVAVRPAPLRRDPDGFRRPRLRREHARRRVPCAELHVGGVQHVAECRRRHVLCRESDRAVLRVRLAQRPAEEHRAMRGRIRRGLQKRPLPHHVRHVDREAGEPEQSDQQDKRERRHPSLFGPAKAADRTEERAAAPGNSGHRDTSQGRAPGVAAPGCFESHANILIILAKFGPQRPQGTCAPVAAT